MRNLICIFSILIFVGCERRPLIRETASDCLVTINVNWSQLPVKPQGMSVRCYPQGEGVYDMCKKEQISVSCRLSVLFA